MRPPFITTVLKASVAHTHNLGVVRVPALVTSILSTLPPTHHRQPGSLRPYCVHASDKACPSPREWPCGHWHLGWFQTLPPSNVAEIKVGRGHCGLRESSVARNTSMQDYPPKYLAGPSVSGVIGLLSSVQDRPAPGVSAPDWLSCLLGQLRIRWR